MASVDLKCLAFSFLAVLMLLLASEIEATEEEGCKGNFKQLGIECEKYILKKNPPLDPSKECCVQFQNADIPCLCRKFTKDIEEIVSMEKVVYVAKFCNTPLNSGTKCGSYTVPKA